MPRARSAHLNVRARALRIRRAVWKTDLRCKLDRRRAVVVGLVYIRTACSQRSEHRLVSMLCREHQRRALVFVAGVDIRRMLKQQRHALAEPVFARQVQRTLSAEVAVVLVLQPASSCDQQAHARNLPS
eukprot:1124623-Rhodomonas_salina.1